MNLDRTPWWGPIEKFERLDPLVAECRRRGLHATAAGDRVFIFDGQGSIVIRCRRTLISV